ncbi:MAG: hypothetical protein KTR24_00485 [Saprospiraceae bacterium]|nr:hypothetical protein [Saprospiraceae bacterium]
MEKEQVRFRRLSQVELQSLEKEFVAFLASQSITASDWQDLKEQDLPRAERLIDIFSDLVLQKVLEKIELLELRTARELLFVHCRPDVMEMVGVVMEGVEIDLTGRLEKDILEKTLADESASVQLVSAHKSYRLSREEEVFAMLQDKYLISKNTALFERLRTMQHQGKAE